MSNDHTLFELSFESLKFKYWFIINMELQSLHFIPIRFYYETILLFSSFYSLSIHGEKLSFYIDYHADPASKSSYQSKNQQFCSCQIYFHTIFSNNMIFLMNRHLTAW